MDWINLGNNDFNFEGGSNFNISGIDLDSTAEEPVTLSVQDETADCQSLAHDLTMNDLDDLTMNDLDDMSYPIYRAT
jgi:hypothetical protein